MTREINQFDYNCNPHDSGQTGGLPRGWLGEVVSILLYNPNQNERAVDEEKKREQNRGMFFSN